MSPDQTMHHKEYNIVVNARKHVWNEPTITYEQVVKLAFPDQPVDPSITYPVTYSNPHGHDGHLVAGQETEVKEGMIFHVVNTGRS